MIFLRYRKSLYVFLSMCNLQIASPSSQSLALAIANLSREQPSSKNFIALANYLEQLGLKSSQLPGQIKLNIFNNYGYIPIKLLKTLLNSYKG